MWSLWPLPEELPLRFLSFFLQNLRRKLTGSISEWVCVGLITAYFFYVFLKKGKGAPKQSLALCFGVGSGEFRTHGQRMVLESPQD